MLHSHEENKNFFGNIIGGSLDIKIIGTVLLYDVVLPMRIVFYGGRAGVGSSACVLFPTSSTGVVLMTRRTGQMEKEARTSTSSTSASTSSYEKREL